jgi:hypothetical protein
MKKSFFLAMLMLEPKNGQKPGNSSSAVRIPYCIRSDAGRRVGQYK